MVKHNKGDLQVWWIPQVPMKAFYVGVKTKEEAALLLYTLAEYDKFQFENNIKPDYSNAGGLNIFGDNGWEDWYDEDDNDIDILIDKLYYKK